MDEIFPIEREIFPLKWFTRFTRRACLCNARGLRLIRPVDLVWLATAMSRLHMHVAS